MYVIYDLHVVPFESRLKINPVFADGIASARLFKDAEGNIPFELEGEPGVFENPQRQDFYLTFQDLDDAAVASGDVDPAVADVQYLIVGAAVPPETAGKLSGKGAGGNYDISIADTKYFQCLEAKGAIGAGETKRVGFKYLRPPQTAVEVAGVNLEVLNNVGQWVETTAKITLSGGYVPMAKSPTQEITLHLKAYLRQI